MNFTQAITSGFQNYSGFSGRACRSEFWFWMLFNFLLIIVAVVIDASLFGLQPDSLPVFQVIVTLALVVPGLAVAVRRLHDIDRSGWWYLINLIPLVGFIIFIVWACTIGTQGPNRFGPDPLSGAPR